MAEAAVPPAVAAEPKHIRRMPWTAAANDAIVWLIVLWIALYLTKQSPWLLWLVSIFFGVVAVFYTYAKHAEI